MMNKTLILISVIAFMFSLSLLSTEAKACGEWCEGLYSSGFCSLTESCVYFEGYGDCVSDPNCSPVDLCAGVTCPGNTDGPCDYYDDCDTSGSYLITYWTCNSATGLCESGSTYGTCSRNTDGASCGAGQVCSGGSCVSADPCAGVTCPSPVYGAWSSCVQSGASCSGTQSRTVTTYSCSGGVCPPSTTTDTQSCPVADGTSCGSETYGSCQYSSTCDTTGDRARTTYSCLGGSCQQLSSTNYDDIACTRNTDGLVCTTVGGQSGTCSGGNCIAAALCGNGALDIGETCDYASTTFGVGWQCLNYREQYCNSDCSGWRADFIGPCNQQCRGDIIVCNKAYPGDYCGPVGEEATAVCDYNCNCGPAGTLILLSCTGNQLVQSEYLTLSWTEVGNAYSYYVYYKSSAVPTYTLLEVVLAPRTLSVTSILPVGAYSWYVEAYDADGLFLQGSQIGECGTTDLTQTIAASKTYAAIGENIELTVTGQVSSPRYLIALAVYFQGDWQYCCCKSGCGYGTGSMCLFSGAQSCSNTWGVTASSSDLGSPVFRYSSGSYDWGPVGDTETAQGGGTYGASVVVNLKECNIDQDCINLGKTCAAYGYPNRYAGCDSSTYTCTRCGVCTYNSDCEPSYCCEDIRAGGPAGTQCVSKGIYTSNPKYLCDPPGWEVKEQKTSNRIQDLFNWLVSLFGVRS